MSNVTLKRRLASIIYDSLLILSVMIIGTLPFIAIRYGDAVETNSNYYQLTLFIIIYFFLVGFWSISGRTLGMQSWGLRLETLEGNKPNIIQCTIRFFAGIFSAEAKIASSFPVKSTITSVGMIEFQERNYLITQDNKN